MESLSQQRFEMGREAGLKEGSRSTASKCVLALMETLDVDVEEAMEMLKVEDDDRDVVRGSVNGSFSQ